MCCCFFFRKKRFSREILLNKPYFFQLYRQAQSDLGMHLLGDTLQGKLATVFNVFALFFPT